MQKIIFFLVLGFSTMSCKKTENDLLNGFYYSKEQKELMIIRDGGKTKEIYNVLLWTSQKEDSLTYNCMECPNGETTLQLTQSDSMHIKVEAEYKEAYINSKFFQKLDFTTYDWDSLQICTPTKCKLLLSNQKYESFINNVNSTMSLSDEIKIITNPDFIFFNKVTDHTPVEITIYYKSKDVLMRKSRGLHSYLYNLHYIVDVCLSEEIKSKKGKECEF